MQERPEIAEKRAQTTTNVEALSQAMGQLLRLPAELGGGGAGTASRAGPGRTDLARGLSSARLGSSATSGSAPALDWHGVGGSAGSGSAHEWRGSGGAHDAALSEATAAGAAVSPSRRRGGAAAGAGGGGGSAARDAAQVAARGLEMYRGLNVSSVGMRSAAARPVRTQSAERNGVGDTAR